MIGGTKLELRNMNSIIIHKRLSLLFVLLYLHLRSGHSTLITFPRDAEVLVNQSTYFNCSTSIRSEQIHWYHYRVGENQTNYVYYKGQFNQVYAERYSIEIDNKTGEYNLIIRSAQHGDAGRYVCQDDVGLGNSSSAELIVLDSTPECLSNMKPDGFVGPNSCYLPLEKLQLSCNVSYRGNIPPMLQWKMDGNDVPILRGIVNDYSGKHATVNLTTNSTVEMDGHFFTCGTTRSHEKQLSCTTDAVNIHYEDLAKSDEACNCESYKNAVICIVVLLLIPLSIGVVTLTLMLIYNRRPKRRDFFHEFFPCMKKSQPKEINEITDMNNLEVSQKNEPIEEEPESDTNEGDKLTEDPEAAVGQARLPSIPAVERRRLDEIRLRREVEEQQRLLDDKKRRLEAMELLRREEERKRREEEERKRREEEERKRREEEERKRREEEERKRREEEERKRREEEERQRILVDDVKFRKPDGIQGVQVIPYTVVPRTISVLS